MPDEHSDAPKPDAPAETGSPEQEQPSRKLRDEDIVTEEETDTPGASGDGGASQRPDPTRRPAEDDDQGAGMDWPC
jgi:hypothetical protein